MKLRTLQKKIRETNREEMEIVASNFYGSALLSAMILCPKLAMPTAHFLKKFKEGEYYTIEDLDKSKKLVIAKTIDDFYGGQTFDSIIGKDRGFAVYESGWNLLVLPCVKDENGGILPLPLSKKGDYPMTYKYGNCTEVIFKG